MKDTRLKVGMLESVSDAGDLRRGEAMWLGRTGQPIQIASIYGVVHNPPAGSQVLLLSQNGQESNSIGIVDHPAIRPLKNLAPGEVAMVNYLTGAYVIFKANGNIEVVTTANLVATVGGSVTATIAGNMSAAVTGNITATAAQISLNGVIIDAAGNITTTGVVTAHNFITV